MNKETSSNGSKHFTISISALFAIVISLVVAVPMIAITASNLRISSSNTYGLLDKYARTMFDLFENRINKYIEVVEGGVDGTLEQVAAGSLSIEKIEETTSFIRGVLTTSPNVEAFLILDVDGNQTTIAKEKSFESGNIGAIDAHFAQLELFLKEGTFGWNDYIVSDDIRYLSYSAELVDGSGDSKIVAAIVPTHDLSQILREVGQKLHASAFVLDGDNSIVAHSSFGKSNILPNEFEAKYSLEKTDDQVLRHFEKWQSVNFLRRAQESGATTATIDTEATRALIIYKEMAALNRNPWVIGIHFQGEEIEAEVTRFWWAILLSVIAVISAIILAFVIGRWLSQPIKQVFTQANQITTLDFDKIEDLPSSSISEIDKVSQSFNAMLRGIKVFADYVPKALVTRLIRSGLDSSQNSTEREVTIMFTDIVGFTSLSEGVSAAETAELLNTHFELLSSIVEKCHGTVDKYMGDGMLAFWGAPEALENHAEEACRAAIEIAEELKKTDVLHPGSKYKIRLRIGIHTGSVIVGNIGGIGRINYTIVGDAVNVCQRLQDLGRKYSESEEVTLIISAATNNKIDKNVFHTRALGTQFLKGREKAIETYLLMA